MGYDLCRFIKHVDSEFQCPICRDVLENAVESQHCQHNFCETCIKTWLSSNSICPIDRTALISRDIRPIPRSLRNLLLKLEIKCNFEQEGCYAVVTLENLESHANSCSFNPNLIVICDRDCGLEILNKEYATHNCMKKLVGLVLTQQTRISSLEKEVCELKSKNKWRMTNGMSYTDDTIECDSAYSKEISQSKYALNRNYCYFDVKIVELGDKKDNIRVGLFERYFPAEEDEPSEENSVINYRSDGTTHVRISSTNLMAYEKVGRRWKSGDTIRCGIKSNAEQSGDVIVYFNRNNLLVAEKTLEYSEDKFYPSIFINGGEDVKVIPNSL